MLILLEMSKIIKRLPLQLIIFIFFFGCFGLFINSNNVGGHHPHHIGIEALTERHHFYLEGSKTPKCQPIAEAWADVIPYKGHLYVGRQPGVFIFGSIAYFFISKSGITYYKDYALAGELVILFTSVLLTAIAMVLLFNIAFNITNSSFNSFLVALFCGFGTLVFPYSGEIHHDIFSIFFLLCGFYILFYKYHINKNQPLLFFLLSGFLTGLAFLCSFKAPPLIIIIFLYVLFHKNWKESFLFILSIFVGILPSLLYNLHIFGNPFIFPETYGDYYPTSLPRYFSFKNLLDKFNTYFINPFTALPLYSPIYLVSLFGFTLFPKKYTIEKMILPCVFFMTFFQMTTILSAGACQYGPRNFLCTMPFTLIGLSGFFSKEKNDLGEILSRYKYLNPLIILAGVFSIIVCSTGSIIGIINCDYYNYAFLAYLARIISGDIPEFRFITFGVILIFISIILFFTKDTNAYTATIRFLQAFHKKYGYKIIGFICMIILIPMISVILCIVGKFAGITICEDLINNLLINFSKTVIYERPIVRFVITSIEYVLLLNLLFLIINPHKLKISISAIRTFLDEYKSKWLLLTVIMAIGFLLRTFKLDTIPPGLYVDEALFGYNAYSISETGRDETGEILPAFFKAYGYYLSNGMYYYCAAIFIKLFGPTIFALRLTSCFLGLLTIFFTYKLTKLYFSEKIALLAAFLLSISPWAIQYSRISMDPSALPPFIVLGLYLFSLGLKDKNKYIVFSSIPIGLSFYCYAPARLFVPLLYCCLLSLNFKKVIEKKDAVITCFVIVLVMLMPFTKYHGDLLQNRFNMISITNSYFSLEPAKKEFEKSGLAFFTKNSMICTTVVFIRNYLKHISSSFLLEKGDGNLRHNVGGRGQLLWFTYWAGFIGLVSFFFNRNLQLYIFPLWFLIFPIPSSLTWEAIPHAGRSICGLPIFEILAAVGFCYILSLAKKLLATNKLTGIVVCSLITLFTVYGIKDFKNYLHKYFVEFPLYSRPWFDYEVTAILKATEKIKEYDIFITPFEIPNYSYLFMHKVNPKEWQKKGGINKFIKDDQFNFNKNINKKVARIVRPEAYQNEQTIHHIYDELTGNLIYEIKKVSNPSKRETKNFHPKITGGLQGKYFNDDKFNDLKLERMDPLINFNWIWGTPNPAINNTKFSAIWSGWIQIEEPGNYQFITESEGGIELVIDDLVVIQDHSHHPPTIANSSLNLASGWYPIVLKLRTNSGLNIINLKWVPPGSNESNIPPNLLSPDYIYTE